MSATENLYPSSPATDSDSDSSSIQADERDMTRLSTIKTIAQLYKEGVLKAAAAEAVQHAAKPALLNRISLFQGDITKLDVDAIVNAANKSLLGGGGVDGAIHAAAGPKLLSECRQLNGCLTGESKITRGYDLPARHVIHTVGPVYSGSNLKAKAEQLASCYKTSLQLALENSLRHIAFPSISTGIYGYPIDDATHIALQVARDLCDSEDGDKLERIIFVVWSNRDKGVYERLIPQYFPPGVEAEESSEPEPPVPEEPVPENSVPEDSVPEDPVPEASVPEQPVPEATPASEDNSITAVAEGEETERAT